MYTLPKDTGGYVLPILQPGTNAEVDGTNGTTQSSVFSAAEYSVVRVAAVTAIRIAIGTDPTALATSMAMGAGTSEYFSIPPNYKIAVIGGKATCTIMN